MTRLDLTLSVSRQAATAAATPLLSSSLSNAAAAATTTTNATAKEEALQVLVPPVVASQPQQPQHGTTTTTTTTRIECLSMTAGTASLLLPPNYYYDHDNNDKKDNNPVVNSGNSSSSTVWRRLPTSLPLADILADAHEVQLLTQAIESLLQQQAAAATTTTRRRAPEFITCDVVFRNHLNQDHPATEDTSTASTTVGSTGSSSDVWCPYQDRSALRSNVFRSPMTAIHTAGPQHLACMVHLQLLHSPTTTTTTNNNNDKKEQQTYQIQLAAVEYSREHRAKLLRQEFGSWLLEEHMEKSVIATDAAGTVVFWNRFAEQLFQYSATEAIGQRITDMVPTHKSLEPCVEIFAQIQKGLHWSGMFELQRKDGTIFTAHVTDTPITDAATGELKFIVGVSADYSVLHNLMNQLETLNVQLEQQVQARTAELLEREKTLRMVGAAIQQSDTGVFIVTADEDCVIVWANDAVLQLLGINDKKNNKNKMLFSSSNNNKADANANNATIVSDDDDASDAESHKSTSSSKSSSSSSEAAKNIFGLHPWDLPFLQLHTTTTTTASGGHTSQQASTSTTAGTAEQQDPQQGLDIESFFKSSKHAETMALVRRRKIVHNTSSSPSKNVKERKSKQQQQQRRNNAVAAAAANPHVDSVVVTKRESTHGEELGDNKTSNNNDDDDEYELVHLSVAVQDLVDTKQKMIILRDLTSQVAAEKAQLAAEKAAAASRTKTEMMQMLSHEFRTPLQGIMGVASTMLIDMAPEEGMMFDNLSTILASSRLLLTLINNILDIGKMDADKMDEIELATIPVLPSVRDAITFCEPFAAINEVRLYLEETTANVDNNNNNNSSTTTTMPAMHLQEYTVKSHRLRLEQVLINLISNGIKYTRPGTDVIVSIRQCTAADAWLEATHAAASDFKVSAAAGNNNEDTGFATESNNNSHNNAAATTTAADDSWKTQTDKMVTIVSIRDHGAGISADEFQIVFGRYVQLRASREKDSKYGTSSSHMVGQSSGSGLGLALVLNFVTRMNGHIWINNYKDKSNSNNNSSNNNEATGGAIFSFCFPAGDPPEPAMMGELANAADENHSQQQQQQQLELSSADAAKFRVLVVDDSMINLKVLQRMLMRLGVKQIKTCTSGRQALAYMHSIGNNNNSNNNSGGTGEEGPNLILSDIQMPDMNGYQLMGHLRELPLQGEAPKVMACSADWTPETEWKCNEVGFDGVLRKPLTLSDLQNFLADTAADMFHPPRNTNTNTRMGTVHNNHPIMATTTSATTTTTTNDRAHP